MFLFTVTKPGLRQAGALALCAVCLAGTVTAAVRLAGKSVTASATVQTTIENTQDIGTYFEHRRGGQSEDPQKVGRQLYCL